MIYIIRCDCIKSDVGSSLHPIKVRIMEPQSRLKNRVFDVPHGEQCIEKKNQKMEDLSFFIIHKYQNEEYNIYRSPHDILMLKRLHCTRNVTGSTE